MKDVSKWETLCYEGAEIASKRLNVNKTGAYSNSSFLGTSSTLGTPSTPIAPGSEIDQLKKRVGYSSQLEEKPPKEKLRRKWRIQFWR